MPSEFDEQEQAKKALKKKESEESYKINSRDVDMDFKMQKASVFFVKGLSNEVINAVNSQMNLPKIKSYIEAQFENEQDVEQYYEELRKALAVQFQKEANISQN